MMDKRDLERRYEGILAQFFGREEERALFEVSGMGKELVTSRLGPDVLLDIHSACLNRLLEKLDPLTISRMVVNANEILLNGIMAYAMNYYSFMDILESHKKELEQANIKLKEIDRLKSMFIASMSHELRTPLNSVIGFSSILLKEWVGPLNTEQKENLSIILKAGKHLLALINDVIDVSKIEAGVVEPVIADFDLYDVMVEVVNLFSEEMGEKGIELRVEPIHLNMHTDRKRLLQCILNLMSNAVKFTEKGDVRVTAHLATDEGRMRPSSVVIAAEDTGIGIKEEDLLKLFQPFVRLDSPLRSKVLGTGLGLYLTRKLAKEILRGDIAVISRYGEGSVFTLKIPVTI